MYELMLKCWDVDFEKRPAFEKVWESLDKMKLQLIRNKLTGKFNSVRLRFSVFREKEREKKKTYKIIFAK